MLASKLASKPNLRELASDDRGVMMVVGVAFATFLIGACWYVFGIGNAINYREHVQNAADATAFAAAVYDARGMNIIAMVNLVMASILAVLVVVRMVQAAIVAVNIVSCLLGAVFDPVCDATTAMEPEIDRVANSVARPVETAMKALHYTESGVGVVWPWLSEGKSTIAALDYRPAVVFGTTWATAQIPMSLDNPLDYYNMGLQGITGISLGPTFGVGSRNPFQNSSGGFSGDANFLGRYGLPVSNDTFNDTCAMAAAVSFDLARLTPPAAIIPQHIFDAIREIAEFIVGNGSYFFCGDDTSSLVAIARSLIGKTTALPVAGPLHKVLSTDHSVSSGMKSPGELATKALYQVSTMGDYHYAVWSTVAGNWSDPFAKGVEVAGLLSKSKPTVENAPDSARLGVAKSEFYYEPQAGDTVIDEESGTGFTGFILSPRTLLRPQNCVWNMRWRARLRRYTGVEGAWDVGVIKKLFNGNLSGAFSQAEKAVGGEVGAYTPPAWDDKLPKGFQNWLGGESPPKPQVGIYH